ncbi:SDR family NAD(P)-dependent oxidoreductase [Mesorhizobium sp. M1C.F.Ca.ET.193.01.1.1]|uniref:SDR family NAD(P)-dependent oxidoreductase n=1 Tax=unclassified Mesorhizobium TaxID=325217 RepID=UPI000FD41E21|nr:MULTISPECIES: SDR family NAD(P)-dependent oxidoreductase [unclassified Mesorhizobium]TGS98783.1 SDR family NAD(P)-dependent oxidoreductase [bacterium M00.F.Ca.ET.177.01.1.1]TGQ52807.1 SDR family NAD(P)-dependent oxidoreductase [Mesorhizobium sp. M1C.F.Ca.ET.210.01.1.1]TGQ70094.1 SDR family NAD(P)-dependent oxidoreductase [Mesorhizobium sp. M1C.F.Ca.ET.212.01.1.1]TGR05891.1 SDR family NAD(P)-dependent oxidoreductase [Mesorhizobium sp. M1C.F.Ca.ET.204.01.1.1]TGR26630.1 SDR family NAD(P)-depen
MTTRKNALVTGANKGIGLETARRLAALGFKVWLGARDAQRGAAAAEALRGEGSDVEWLELDVTSDESVAAAAQTIAARVSSLDVLVNNAGIAPGYVDALGPDGRYERPPSREDIADIRAIYDVNVFGPVRVTQAFLLLLLASSGARVVMVSSYLGSIARAAGESQSPNVMGYGSSKTALNAITVAFARELAPRGIMVNAAAPGYTATDLNGHKGHRTVQQAAEIVVRLATLDAGGPTGGYFDENGPLPW